MTDTTPRRYTLRITDGRYTLRITNADGPITALPSFDTLNECSTWIATHRNVAIREGIYRVRIADALTRKHGTLFPTGRVRWNG